MKDATLENPLVPLPALGLKEGDVYNFSLYTGFYEKALADKGRIDLSSPTLRDDVERADENVYKQLVPSFTSTAFVPGEHPRFREFREVKTLKRILDMHAGNTEPCSMRLADLREIERHILVVYEVSHAHYVLGKRYNLKNEFPTGCCGVSSRNVAFSLMELGYSNAAIGYRRKKDHSAVLLPFVIEDSCGIVIADPTSDQYEAGNMPRNQLNVIFGREGKYEIMVKRSDRVEKADGTVESLNPRIEIVDFFPNIVYYSGKYKEEVDAAIARRRKHLDDDDLSGCFIGANEFFDKAFSNSVELDIPFRSKK